MVRVYYLLLVTLFTSGRGAPFEMIIEDNVQLPPINTIHSEITMLEFEEILDPLFSLFPHGEIQSENQEDQVDSDDLGIDIISIMEPLDFEFFEIDFQIDPTPVELQLIEARNATIKPEIEADDDHTFAPVETVHSLKHKEKKKLSEEAAKLLELRVPGKSLPLYDKDVFKKAVYLYSHEGKLEGFNPAEGSLIMMPADHKIVPLHKTNRSMLPELDALKMKWSQEDMDHLALTFPLYLFSPSLHGGPISKGLFKSMAARNEKVELFYPIFALYPAWNNKRELSVFHKSERVNKFLKIPRNALKDLTGRIVRQESSEHETFSRINEVVDEVGGKEYQIYVQGERSMGEREQSQGTPHHARKTRATNDAEALSESEVKHRPWFKGIFLPPLATEPPFVPGEIYDPSKKNITVVMFERDYNRLFKGDEGKYQKNKKITVGIDQIVRAQKIKPGTYKIEIILGEEKKHRLWFKIK